MFCIAFALLPCVVIQDPKNSMNIFNFREKLGKDLHIKYLRRSYTKSHVRYYILLCTACESIEGKCRTWCSRPHLHRLLRFDLKNAKYFLTSHGVFNNLQGYFYLLIKIIRIINACLPVVLSRRKEILDIRHISPLHKFFDSNIQFTV